MITTIRPGPTMERLQYTRESVMCPRCRAMADPYPLTNSAGHTHKPPWDFTVYRRCRWCRVIICKRCSDVYPDCGRCG